jgi:hypothetical protein
MRICIVGNSHVAALKGASDANPAPHCQYPGFYAVPGGDQPRMRFVEGRLFPADPSLKVLTTVPGARTEGLALADFDIIVLSACGWPAARTHYIELDPANHPLGVVTCAEWVAGDAPGPPATVQRVSQAVFRAVVAAYVRNHPPIKLAVILQQHFHGPVLLQTWPAPNKDIVNDRSWYLNSWYGSRAIRVWRTFIEAQHMALDAIAMELGPRFTHLGYPLPHTRDVGFMEAHWCTSDPWHSNKHYGAQVMKQISACVAS